MLGTKPNQVGLNLEDLRFIVVTGPDTSGRRQVVADLKETEQLLLDVEEVADTNQQKGVAGESKIVHLIFFRRLKRDRATNLAILPNTALPPNLSHVKGEGERNRNRNSIFR